MQDRDLRCSRRKFLASAAALTLGSGVAPAASAKDLAGAGLRARPPKPTKEGRKPIAVLTTVYRPMSHAYHIGGRFINGYIAGSHFHIPQHYVASLYVDQKPANDLSRELGRDFGVRVCGTIAETLTQGGDKLAVDGVLLIGEHSSYPRDEKGQILYPRATKMMEEIVSPSSSPDPTSGPGVQRQAPFLQAGPRPGRWTAGPAGSKIPFMAGSSLPVTWKRLRAWSSAVLQAQVEDALVAAYGPIEVYGCHALEALQAMCWSRRKGGETGVKAVTCLTGSAVWEARAMPASGA